MGRTTNGRALVAVRAGTGEDALAGDRAVTGGHAAVGRVVAAAWAVPVVRAVHGAAVRRSRTARARAHDAGMATAEYAVATLAAVGFAGVLVVVLKGNEVKGLLSGIVRQALGA